MRFFLYKLLTKPETSDEKPEKKEVKNFFTHLASLTATKSADGFIDPKLVLSSLLLNAGISAAWLAWLVPIREAGALLFQVPFAHWSNKKSHRKQLWSLGSILQGVCIILMAVAFIWFDGHTLAITVLVTLGLFASARCLSSVTAKDLLGRTLRKEVRATASGSASSAASAVILIYALVLTFSLLQSSSATLITFLLIAGLLWISAGLFFAFYLEEKPVDPDTKNDDLRTYFKHLFKLLDNSSLTRFITVRALLTSSALAPPFMILVTSESSPSSTVINQIGIILLTSSAAGFLSGVFWGRQADKCSKTVLQRAGLLTFATLSSFLLANYIIPNSLWLLALHLFLIMIAHHGVKLGRKAYLIELAPSEQRLDYTAYANTLIGLLLLASGALGIIAQYTSAELIIAVLALLGLTAFISGKRLKKL